MQRPVIVIPGITATSLHDDYPLQTLDIWTMILNKDYHRTALHPDNPRYEAYEPARVYAGKLFAIYNEFIDTLRHELSLRADKPTPVFAFPYDWRRPLSDTAQEFSEFVQEVIERTQLLRHYSGFKGAAAKVDLVGHSMGGLVICEYLSRFGASCVGRVATLGTPFLGSMEAVVKLTTGLGNLSGARPSERERETARSTPAVYQLLPSYDGAAKSPRGRAVDLFEIGSWQTTVLESLAEYIRMHGVNPPTTETALMSKARKLLGEFLEGARQHRDRVKRLKLDKCGLKPEDWLAVIGVGERTRQSLVRTTENRRIRFDVEDDPPKDDEALSGDGTVPVRGAMPPFLSAESVVAVRRGHIEWFEMADQALLRSVGLHAILTNINLVQRLVIRHFWQDFAGNVTGDPAPGVQRSKWKPPIKGLV